MGQPYSPPIAVKKTKEALLVLHNSIVSICKLIGYTIDVLEASSPFYGHIKVQFMFMNVFFLHENLARIVIHVKE